jgi:hypothetical protein
MIGGLLATVALIAFIVASVSVGGAESEEGLRETADVTIGGSPLPAYPEAGDDPAVGMAMPELEGISFDGTPVSITNDGRAKVIVFLSHW